MSVNIDCADVDDDESQNFMTKSFLYTIKIRLKVPDSIAFEDLCGQFANPAGPDYTGGLSVHVVADESIQGKVVFADAIVGSMNSAVEGMN